MALRSSPALYFASYGLSLLGSGIASVVMPLLVLARTGDVLAAGLIASASTAASALTGLVSGLLVDRVDRRLVSFGSTLLTALSLAALPLVDVLWGLDLGWFLALAVVSAIIRIPGMTAHETLLPALARLGRTGPGRLDRLVASRETVANVLLLAGPGLGGLLIGLLGTTPLALLTTAGTSVLAALCTLALDPRAGRIPAGPLRKSESAGVAEGEPSSPTLGAVRHAVGDLVGSWRFVARNPILLGSTLVSAVLVAVIAALQSTLMPAYFTGVGEPGMTGLTLSALAAGSIAGSALYLATAGRVRRRTWFVVGMVGLLVGFAAVGSMVSPWVVLAGAAVVGLTNAPSGAILGVLTIEATPDALRGRVLGAQNTIMLAAPALTTAPVAALASAAGLPVAGIVLAAAVAATAVVALVVPAFRSLEPPVEEPVAEPVGAAAGG
jgi:MFS family permease